MIIYEIKPDIDLLLLSCEDNSDLRKLRHAVIDVAPLNPNESIKLRVNAEAPGDYIESDFPRGPAYGALLLSERAIEVLEPFLKNAGYFVQVENDETKTSYRFFMCDKRLDAIDVKNSKYTSFKDGAMFLVYRYELKRDILAEADIFKLAQRPSKLFVSDKFVRAVEEAGLIGFVFTRIWSSDEGGTELTPDRLPLENVPGEFARAAKAKRQAVRRMLAERERAGDTASASDSMADQAS